jgi:hypothetical protein
MFLPKKKPNNFIFIFHVKKSMRNKVKHYS